MNRICFLIVMIFGVVSASAQQLYTPLTDSTEKRKASRPGMLTIQQDERITQLLDTLTELNIPVSGYRIQLSFGKKEEINELRTEFLKIYPETGAYLSWLQPNFRLRVGDFRTRIEAERFKHEIQETFPNCYIVRDEIAVGQADQ